MKKINKIFAGTIVIIGLATFISASASAQLGSSRVELQRHDLSISGREILQVIVNISEGQTASRHKHPGEEIIYVVQGLLEYEVEGKAPITLKAGDVLFIPNGTIHSAKNVGEGNAAELATYIVEKRKPLVILAK